MDTLKIFEYDVENYISKKNIYKNNWDYLLQALFCAFEHRVSSITEKTCGVSLIEQELNILDQAVRLCADNFRVTTRKSIDIKNLNNFFEDIFNYLDIKNAYILYLNDYFSVDIKQKNVVFRNLKIDPHLEVLNFYNKLSFSSNMREQFALSSNHKTDNALNDIYMRIQVFIKNAVAYKTEFPLESELNLQNIYDVYAGLMAYGALSLLARDGIIFMEREKLINHINRLTDVPITVIEKIFKLFTYNRKQKLDIIHTPLFEILDQDKKECYLVSASLLLSSNIERNILILIKEKLKSNPFDGEQEEVMSKHIKNSLQQYSNLFMTTNIKLLKDSKDLLTDIDLILFDSNTNVLICGELKNFVYADSLQQHLNVQGRKDTEQLNKAYEQVKKIKDYFNANILAMSKTLFEKGIRINQDTKLEFVVISNNNLGYYNKYDIPILETDNFIKLCLSKKADLEAVVSSIRSDDFRENIKQDFVCEDKEISFAGYKITYPYYYINHYGKENIL